MFDYKLCLELPNELFSTRFNRYYSVFVLPRTRVMYTRIRFLSKKRTEMEKTAYLAGAFSESTGTNPFLKRNEFLTVRVFTA